MQSIVDASLRTPDTILPCDPQPIQSEHLRVPPQYGLSCPAGADIETGMPPWAYYCSEPIVEPVQSTTNTISERACHRGMYLL